MQPVPGRQRIKIYHLNEQQAKLIITYLGNTALVREFKKAMTRQFYAVRKKLITRRASRSASLGVATGLNSYSTAEFTEHQCLETQMINLLELRLPYEQIKYSVLAKARPIPRD